jgi:DNA-binding NarL/FixJ family response regulator
MSAQVERIRVAVVEDDDEIRGHLDGVLTRATGFECVARSRTGEEAVAQFPLCSPDVILMDINLPGMTGIDCVRRMKALLPAAQILMFTIYEDSDRIFESLTAGASGYLLKRTPADRLLEAIREVRGGGSPMTSHIARKVVQHFNQLALVNPELEALSHREREVLQRLARGLLYKEIADELGVTLDTVRKHLQSIYQKLHVHSRTDAVVKFLGK